MSRASRLLELIQLLRRHRAPITGPALMFSADEIEALVVEDPDGHRLRPFVLAANPRE